MVFGPLLVNSTMFRLSAMAKNVLLLIIISTSHGQTFVLNESLSDSLPQSKANSIKIVDVNRDGVYDIIISGYDENRYGLYFDISLGTLDGNLLSSKPAFPSIATFPDTVGEYIGGLGNITVADIDRDGSIDAYLNGSGYSLTLLNQSEGFAIPTNFILNDLSLTYSHASFADVDNNGASDLFVMGSNSIFGDDFILNALYINDGTSNMSRDPLPNFPDFNNGSSEWVDYDNDGDKDLIISGTTADYQSSATRFYKNDPIGRLIEDTNQDIVGVKASSSKFVDIDSDGDQDLIISGWNIIENSLITKVYKNEPLGTFTEETSSNITFGVAYGTIDVIDFDMDGDLDIAIAGVDSVQNYATDVFTTKGKLYRNEGEFQFNEVAVYSGARIIRFADINGDLRPDIITNGTTDITNRDSTFTKVYINQDNTENQLPEPPIALTSFAVSTRAIFTWGSGSDETDDDISLRYNIKIGRQSGGYELLSPAMEFSNPNIGQRLIKEFDEIPHGNYYWSVQSIDASGKASNWSIEDTLFIPRLVTSTQSLPGVWFSSGGWADYDNDGALDLALTGINFSGSSITKFYLNEDDLLSQDLTQNSEAVFGGHLTWVDYTNDGLLDISLTGMQIINFNGYPATFFYKNVGGKFIADPQENVTTSIYGYTMGISGGKNSHAWGDYDNDGDQDLVIGGGDFNGVSHLAIFVNDDGILKKDSTQTSLVPIFPCMVEWIDVQNDGYLDLITIGADSLGALEMRTYLNDSTFSLSISAHWSNSDVGVVGGAFEFADYNDDGNTDFVYTGLNSNSGMLLTKVMTNTGENFQLISEEHELKGLYYGQPSWIDYDNDGDVDLLTSGFTLDEISGQYVPFTAMYAQVQGQFIIDETIKIDSLSYSFTEFGDYDNDGDADLFAAGKNLNGDVISKVFDNLENIQNENLSPNSPTNLNVLDIDKDKVHLTWDSPSDRLNPSNGYTEDKGIYFQIQMGNEDNGNTHEVISGAYGNNGSGDIKTNFKFVNKIPEGNYSWRVRALDHSKAYSEWSSLNYFYIDVSPPKIDTIRANYLTDKDLIIVVKFEEAFYLDLNMSPTVSLIHPEELDLDNNGIIDTLQVIKQSYNGDEWTGSITLPENYSGKAILIHVKDAYDQRGNKMVPEVMYKAPEAILSQSGGTAISEDGNVFVLLPQGALSADVSLKIEKNSDTRSISDTTAFLIGPAYDVNPSDLVIKKPAIIRMKLQSGFSQEESFSVYIGRVDTSGNVNPLGGTETTIGGEKYYQVQSYEMGTYAIFTSLNPDFIDSNFVDKVVCQPRIFSPRGNIFEFDKTHILYNTDANNPQSIRARIFNLAGRLKRVLDQENNNGAGNQLIVWDGKDDSGKIVPSGLYIITLEKDDTILRTTVGVLNR